jgi:hypothetical protein
MIARYLSPSECRVNDGWRVAGRAVTTSEIFERVLARGNGWRFEGVASARRPPRHDTILWHLRTICYAMDGHYLLEYYLLNAAALDLYLT